MDYEKLIRELVDRKAEQDNQIDLNAYENGMRALVKALSLHNVVWQSEQFSLADMKEAYTAGENNAGSYTYTPFEEWFSKR